VIVVVASCTKLADLTSRGAVDDNTAALVVDDGYSALPVALGTDALRSLQPRAAQLPHVLTSRTTDTLYALQVLDSGAQVFFSKV